MPMIDDGGCDDQILSPWSWGFVLLLSLLLLLTSRSRKYTEEKLKVEKEKIEGLLLFDAISSASFPSISSSEVASTSSLPQQESTTGTPSANAYASASMRSSSSISSMSSSDNNNDISNLNNNGNYKSSYSTTDTDTDKSPVNVPLCVPEDHDPRSASIISAAGTGTAVHVKVQELAASSSGNCNKPMRSLSKLTHQALVSKSEDFYMFPPSDAFIRAVDEREFKFINDYGSESKIVVEIWQSQKYWKPFFKWGESMNMPEFVDNLSFNASSTFPATIDFSWISDPDSGFSAEYYEWEAGSSWQVDLSKRFGDCCEEGWMYGDSFKGILESMMMNKTCSETSSFTKKRRRIWVRTLRFVHPTTVES